jgi:hypothetical protein
VSRGIPLFFLGKSPFDLERFCLVNTMVSISGPKGSKLDCGSQGPSRSTGRIPSFGRLGEGSASYQYYYDLWAISVKCHS